MVTAKGTEREVAKSGVWKCGSETKFWEGRTFAGGACDSVTCVANLKGRKIYGSVGLRGWLSR